MTQTLNSTKVLWDHEAMTVPSALARFLTEAPSARKISIEFSQSGNDLIISDREGLAAILLDVEA